jgi:hypothetical protein
MSLPDLLQDFTIKLINDANSSLPIRKSIELDKTSNDACHIVQDFKRKETQLKDMEFQIRQTETQIEDIQQMFRDISVIRKKLECEIILSNTMTNNEDTDILTDMGNKYIDKLCILQTDLLDDKKKYLKTLEEKKLLIEENLNALRNFILLGVKEIVNTEVAKQKLHLCPICFTNEVDICLEPCGHTICSSCSDKVNHSCMVCRKHIEKKIRLYFSA